MWQCYVIGNICLRCRVADVRFWGRSPKNITSATRHLKHVLSDIIHLYSICDTLIGGLICNGPVVYETLSECLIDQGPARVGWPSGPETNRWVSEQLLIGGCDPSCGSFAVKTQSLQDRFLQYIQVLWQGLFGNSIEIWNAGMHITM